LAWFFTFGQELAILKFGRRERTGGKKVDSLPTQLVLFLKCFLGLRLILVFPTDSPSLIDFVIVS